MAKKRSPRKQSAKLIILSLCAVLILCAAAHAVSAYPAPGVSAPADANAPSGADELCVMAIDVGQGDSILVTFGADQTMLIDAGDSSAVQAVEEELNERGITQIDVLVATHPHADHIGGMSRIIGDYEIGCIYMPDMGSDSKTYKNLMAAIERRKIPLVTAYAGETFELGGASCTIVSPGREDDKDANNESVMMLVDYIDSEFLFAGDAEEWAEERVLERGYGIDADVLKVAHHGSHTGTSEAFLKAVSPDYAVISCGKGNDYGHPHEETLKLLDEYGVDTLRTDISGDVLFLTDGHTLKTVLGD